MNHGRGNRNGDREQRLNEVMAAYVLDAETNWRWTDVELIARHPDLAAEMVVPFHDFTIASTGSPDRSARPLGPPPRRRASAAGQII